MTQNVTELMVCGGPQGGRFPAKRHLRRSFLMKTKGLPRYFGKYLLARKVR
jgi:hypothetical protein